MVDAHVHIERGPYEIEWIEQFVDYAIKREIDSLYLLEHSHRFIEFSNLYAKFAAYNDYQAKWLSNKLNIPLGSYTALINRVRSHKWPIEIKFGLEVCYDERHEDLIYRLKRSFDWDFFTGSVHWIDGWGFDHKPEFWEDKEPEKIYVRYYEIMKKLVKSGLFDILAHPDSIKCFGHLPDIDPTSQYRELAVLLNKTNMKVEQSAGLRINYNHPELGMNKHLLTLCKENNVSIITASDAHKPEDVGRFIREMISE